MAGGLFRDRRRHVDELGRGKVARETLDALFREGNDPVRDREERVVGTLHHVVAGTDRGAALADQDVAGFGEFAGEFLHAKTLAMGITAVGCGTGSFFVCHKKCNNFEQWPQFRRGNPACQATGKGAF